MFGNINFGLVNRLGGCFLTDRIDVPGLVCDIGNVDVNQEQADFIQLRRNILADRVQKTLAVLIDLLYGQRSHGEAQLTKDNFLCHLLNFSLREVEQTLGSGGHDFRFSADADRESGGNVNAYIL